MLRKITCCTIVVLSALALAAQTQTHTQTTATAAIETVGTNPSATSTITTTTTTTTTKKKVVRHREIGPNKPLVYSASTRLASLLADTADKATLSADAWKHVAAEAVALSDQVKRGAKGSADVRHAALDLGSHVHEMHEAAAKGDADGARAHANMALPYAYKLIDWAAP